MKTIFVEIKKRLFYILMIGYCIYDHNWIAVFAFLIGCGAEMKSDMWEKYSRRDDIEIKKWYNKYMNAKYGTPIPDDSQIKTNV